MKSLLAVISLSVMLLSCSKQDVAAPVKPSAQLFYKDGSIAVSAMQAVQTSAGAVTVKFSTQYVNSVAKIEVMSGTTTALLCTIGEIDLPGNIEKAANFSVTDTNLKGKTMYYMLRYTSTNGDWGYTPLVSVTLQ